MLINNIRYFECSDNQKYMMHPYEIAKFQPIIIKNRPSVDFEMAFRDFIKFHPSLCTIFKSKGKMIVQGHIHPSEVKINFIYDVSIQEKDKISQLLLEPFDVYNKELIRVIVVKNKDQFHLFLSMPYAIVDAYSKMILSKEIKSYFDGSLSRKTSSLSNIDFIKSQKKFLVSQEGETNRRYWREILKSYTVKNKVFLPKDDINKYVSQKFILHGTHFEFLDFITKKYKLPITAITLSFLQNLISQLFKDPMFLNVRTNGRDDTDLEFDLDNFIGVVNNTVPLLTLKNSVNSIREYLHICFTKYCEARMNQRIPYNMIEKDFSKLFNVELENYVAGIFNFNVMDVDREVSLNNTKKTKSIYAKESIILNCYQFNNALELELLCLEEVYNKNPDLLDFQTQLELFFKVLN